MIAKFTESNIEHPIKYYDIGFESKDLYLKNPEKFERDLKTCQFDENYIKNARIKDTEENSVKTFLDLVIIASAQILINLYPSSISKCKDLLESTIANLTFVGKNNLFYNRLRKTAQYQRKILRGETDGTEIPQEYGLDRILRNCPLF